ncbi:SURF1 family cytochrome oxidase biogenesis protein [Sphingomonas mollis]|uniref:SURF1 family protein n=1 Tax=Sphingomonas mollis TaxID=2795726 RepID=A0ABS0XTI1_9SPHN|nr:SURF1 family cytochrome oxidase biogenesis protein [Sphingomonas sp. BT553]MBJ6123048.1 SURF1 family protein [Sphingomonas sp. BT553]
MTRFRPIPTLLVALAVATMIALGLWQLLDRLPRKEAFLAQLESNPTKSPIGFPRLPDDRLLFRQSAGDCLPPVAVRLAGAGKAGFRAIADCSNGMTVQLGTTRDPKAMVTYAGGLVTGYIGHAPDGRSLIGAALSPQQPRLMLVATPPLAGLQANAPPDIASVPNNHIAYAGQWFFFAAIAAIIYVLAARRRNDR